jgi:hypothetical protein
LVCRGEMLQLLGLLLHRATVTRNCEGTMVAWDFSGTTA